MLAPLFAMVLITGSVTADERESSALACRRVPATGQRLVAPGTLVGYLGCADPTLSRPGTLSDNVKLFYDTIEVRAPPSQEMVLIIGAKFGVEIVSIIDSESKKVLLTRKEIEDQTDAYRYAWANRLVLAHGSFGERGTFTMPASGSVLVTVTGLFSFEKKAHRYLLSALDRALEKPVAESLQNPSDFAFQHIETMRADHPEAFDLFLFGAEGNTGVLAAWLKYQGQRDELAELFGSVMSEFRRKTHMPGRLRVFRDVISDDVNIANPLPDSLKSSIISSIAGALGEKVAGVPGPIPGGPPSRKEIRKALDGALDEDDHGSISWAASTIITALPLRLRGARYKGEIAARFERACQELEKSLSSPGYARLHCVMRRSEFRGQSMEFDRSLTSWLGERASMNCTEAFRDYVARKYFITSPLWLDDVEYYASSRLRLLYEESGLAGVLGVLAEVMAAYERTCLSLLLEIPTDITQEMLGNDRGRIALKRYATHLIDLGAPLAACLEGSEPSSKVSLPSRGSSSAWHVENESSMVQGYGTIGQMLLLEIADAERKAGNTEALVEAYDKAEAEGLLACDFCSPSLGSGKGSFFPLLHAIASLANIQVGRERRGRQLWERSLVELEEFVNVGEMPLWVLTIPETRRLALGARQALVEFLHGQGGAARDELARIAVLVSQMADMDIMGPRLLRDVAKDHGRTDSLGIRRLATALQERDGSAASRAQIESAWFDLRSEDLRGLGVSRPVSLARLMDGADALLVYSFPGDQKDLGLRPSAYALSFTRDDWGLVDLGDADTLVWSIAEMRRSLNLRKDSVRAHLAALGEALLPEAVRSLPKNSRLRIFVDGAVALVPFDGLIVDGEYLGRQLEVEILIGSPRDPEVSEPPSDQESVVVGGPSFSCGAKQEGPFFPLSGAEREGAQVAKHLGLDNVRLLIGKDASEDALKDIHSPETLHIATHGFAKLVLPGTEGRGGHVIESAASSSMFTSGLAFSGANLGKSCVPGSVEDGVLTLEEALRLDLAGTQLVVLSACETAVDDPEAGKASIGLQRAFLEAGARTVISTLWQVDDHATEQLMSWLYEDTGRKVDPANALRRAKRRLARSSEFAAPWFWSGFVAVELN